MIKKVVPIVVAWAVAISIVASLVVAATKDNDPIAFSATLGTDLEIYVENYSDTTLVVNHVTVVTSSWALTTRQDVRVADGALSINVPIEWKADEDAVVSVGCSYGQVHFVRQVTKY